jgi:hypothetical protein
VVKILNCISSSGPPLPITYGVTSQKSDSLNIQLSATSLLTQLFILPQKHVPLIYNILLHEFKLKSRVIRHSN